MSVVIIDSLSRGGLGTAPFALTKEADVQSSYLTVADLTARDAIPTWQRLPYMRVYVVSTGLDYRLDNNINTNVWTTIPTGAGVYQPISEKGQPNGYVPLDATGHINPAYITSIYSTNAYVVTDNAARNALTTLTGNLITVTSTSKIFVKMNNNPPTNVDADFAELSLPGVLSVNGNTGAVTVTIANLLTYGTGTTDFNNQVAIAPAVTSLGSTVATNTTNISVNASNIVSTQTYAENHVGLATLTSIAKNPTGAQTGYALVWNGSNYDLQLITGGGGGGSMTASNGLTVVGSDIRLGGTLSGNTSIDGNSSTHNLDLLALNIFSIEANTASVYASTNTDVDSLTTVNLGAADAVTINIGNSLATTDVFVAGHNISLTGTDGDNISISALSTEINANGHVLTLSTTLAQFQASGTNFNLSSVVSGNFTLEKGGTGTFTVLDSRAGAAAVGLEYSADYSANYTARSLVDKAFVWATKGTTTLTASSTINIGSGHYLQLTQSTGTNTSLVTIQNTDISLQVTNSTSLELGLVESQLGFGTQLTYNTDNLGTSDNSVFLRTAGILLKSITNLAGTDYGQLELNTTSHTTVYSQSGAWTGGIQYAADYSAGFTANSLVNKAYALHQGTDNTLTQDFDIEGAHQMDWGSNLTPLTYWSVTSGNGAFTQFSKEIIRQSDVTLTHYEGGAMVGQYAINSTGAHIYGGNSGATPNVVLDMLAANAASAAKFTDNRTTKEGIVYAADYSAGYTSRSLVDQGYVIGTAKSYSAKQSFPVTSTTAGLGLTANASDPTTNLAAGDMYYQTGVGVRVYSGSAWSTLGAGGGTIGGSIANTQVAVGSGVNTIAGNAAFTYVNATGLTVDTALLTGSTSFNIVNTTATTVNIAGAATTLTLGNTATAAQTVSLFTASTGASTYSFATGATTTGLTKTINIGTSGATGSTTAINIGTGLAGTAIGNINIGSTNAASTLTINNSTIVNGNATLVLFNTTSTNISFAGAATTLTIGATTGTATIANATVTFSNATTVNVNGVSPTFASTSTGTLTFFNTNLLTVAEYGAATSYTIGGTPTGAITANFFNNATSTGNTKTINIGTSGATGSTTAINIGTGGAGTAAVNITEGSTTGGTHTFNAVTLNLASAPGSATTNFATSTLLVRRSTGVVEAVTASGGGTTNFLRADGTWSPAGGGGGGWAVTGTTTLTGNVTITGAFDINLGNDTGGRTYSFANGQVATGVTQTINIGNGGATGTGVQNINIGSGILANGTSQTIQIGVNSGSGSSSTQAIYIGSNSSTVPTTITTYSYGTNGFSINTTTMNWLAAGGTFSVATSSASTINFLNSNTVTNFNIGNATTAQTITIGGSSTATGSIYNFGTGVTSNTFSKTINIGTGGASGSTTTVNIGSQTAGALGAINHGNNNISFFTTSPNFYGGLEVIYIGNVATTPTSNPSGGAMYWTDANNDSHLMTQKPSGDIFDVEGNTIGISMALRSPLTMY